MTTTMSAKIQASSVFPAKPSPCPEIDLPRGVSETFTEEYSGSTPGTTTMRSIKVPHCRPTPLIGSWADESWPLNSRQASEIITEQVLQKQRSSTLFEDDNGNVLGTEDTRSTMLGDENQDQNDNEDDSSCPDDQETVDESMMQEAMSHHQHSTEEVESPQLDRRHNHDLLDTASSIEDCLSNSVNSTTHVATSYMYDPYHISNAVTVLCRCTCDVCYSMIQHKMEQEALLQQLATPDTSCEDDMIHQNDSVSNRVSPSAAATSKKSMHAFLAAPPQIVQDSFPLEEGDNSDWDLPTYRPSSAAAASYPKAQSPQQHFAAAAAHQFPTAPAAGQSSGSGFMTHTQISSPPFMDMHTPTQSPGNMNATPGSTISGLSHPPPTQRRMLAPGEKPVAQPREISVFMPPPPPPRIATMVFEEETTIKNPSGIYYHLVMRWYSKVMESQEYFLTADELCPGPNKDRYSFEQWADEVSGWWYTNFEHMQKKGPRFARRR